MTCLLLLMLSQNEKYFDHGVAFVELYDLSSYSSLTDLTPEAGREIGTYIKIKGVMLVSSIWKELNLEAFGPIKEKPAFFPSFILDLTLTNGDVLTFFCIGNWLYDQALGQGRKINSFPPKCIVSISL